MSTAHPDSEIDQGVEESYRNSTPTDFSQDSESSCQDCSTSSENSAMAGVAVDELVEADTVLPTPAPERSEAQSSMDDEDFHPFDEDGFNSGSVDFDNQDEMFSHVDDSEIEVPSEEDNSDEWIGSRVGSGDRYEIIGFVGRGGMANVYLGVDHNRNGIEVAIKVPFMRWLATSAMRERFARESRALVSLEHPSICRVIDTGVFHDIPFVVLQKLGGKNLRHRFKALDLEDNNAFQERLFAWLKPIARALDFMHDKGYVHRDVKPENILFDDNNHAFLGDFGIVRAIGDNDSETENLTRFDSWMGTPGYVAPEVGTDKSLDARCDQYSLACVAYEGMTKKAPFPGKTATEFRTAQATMDPVPIHELNEAIPAAVSVVMERALERNPALRFSNCQELVDALEIALQSSAKPEADVPPQAKRLKLMVSSYRSWLTMSLAVLAVCAVGIALKLGPFNLTSSDASDQQTEVVPVLAEKQLPASQEESKPASSVVEGIPTEPNAQDEETITVDVVKSTKQRSHQVEPAPEVRAVTTRQELAMVDYENGLKYLEVGEHEAALDTLNHAIQYDETRPEFYASRGMVLVKLQKYSEAIEQFDRAIGNSEEISGDVLASWYGARAAAFARSGDFETAIDDVSKSIELNSTDAMNYRNRASLWMKVGESQKARKDVIQAEQIESK